MVNVQKSKKLPETYIGIDYGEKTIGLALGRDGFVTALTTVEGADLSTAFNKINRYAIENKVATFVVGLPLDARGKETKTSLKVRTFAKKLKVYTKKAVEYQNEFASSADATGEMIALEIAQKKRRTNDHFAAAIILRRFFEERK